MFDFNKSERIFIATEIYHNVPPNASLPVHPVPEGANLVPYSDDSTPRLKKSAWLKGAIHSSVELRLNDESSFKNKERPGREAWLPPGRASLVSELCFLQLADLLDENKKSEPFANRLQVRISPIWKGRAKKIPTFALAFGVYHLGDGNCITLRGKTNYLRAG